MKIRLPVLAVATLLLGGVQASVALPVTYTFTGTVSYGIDNAGSFGSKGAVLDGEAFSAVETFDPAKSAYFATDGATQSQVLVGSDFSSEDAGSIKLTIGSVSKSIQNQSSALSVVKGSFLTAYIQDILDPYGFELGYFQFNAAVPTYMLNANYTLGVGDFTTGAAQYQYYSSADSSVYTQIEFSVDKIVVSSSLSPVPLPAGLPLFGAGVLVLGGLGACFKQKVRHKDREFGSTTA